MIYTAQEIKNWDVSTTKSTTDIMWVEKDKAIQHHEWIPAKPLTYYPFYRAIPKRIKLALLVLIGKLDALDWEQ